MPGITAEEFCKLYSGDVDGCLKQLDVRAANAQQVKLLCTEIPEKTWVNQCITRCASPALGDSLQACVTRVHETYQFELDRSHERTNLTLSIAVIAALLLAAALWVRAERRKASP